MKNRILLSGVHGVGKGYFIRHELSHYMDLQVISASELISKYKQSDDGNKRVENINSNQVILLNGIKKVLENNDSIILLDGHLTILSTKGTIERIPDTFFKDGMFNVVFLLQDKPERVHERLYKRDGRYKLSLEEIYRIQEEERTYAKELEERGIDVVYINPDSERSLYSSYFC